MLYQSFWLRIHKELDSIVRVCLGFYCCRKLKQVNTEGIKEVYERMPANGKEQPISAFVLKLIFI